MNVLDQSAQEHFNIVWSDQTNNQLVSSKNLSVPTTTRSAALKDLQVLYNIEGRNRWVLIGEMNYIRSRYHISAPSPLQIRSTARKTTLQTTAHNAQPSDICTSQETGKLSISTVSPRQRMP